MFRTAIQIGKSQKKSIDLQFRIFKAWLTKSIWGFFDITYNYNANNRVTIFFQRFSAVLATLNTQTNLKYTADNVCLFLQYWLNIQIDKI